MHATLYEFCSILGFVMRNRVEKKRRQKLDNLQHAIAAAKSSIISAIGATDDSFTFDESSTTPWVSYCDGKWATTPNSSSNIVDDIDWSLLPTSLDPAAGELQPDRAQRKRQQIMSLIHILERDIAPLYENMTVVDFGAGSGHLGLLFAFRNPSSNVILAERKEYCVEIAHDRIRSCQLSNVSVYSRDIRYVMDDLSFDVGVSLHSCGQLTDTALDICRKTQASFVITPCCYGQIASPPPSFVPDFVNLPFEAFKYLSEISCDVFRAIASGADYNSNEEHNPLAKQCMRIVNLDRMLSFCSVTSVPYQFYLASLVPLNCSPKNDVIVAINRYKLNKNV